MSPVEQTPRIGAQDEMTGIDPAFFTTSAEANAKAAKPQEEKKNTLNLPPPSLAHMPMTAYFRPDDPKRLMALLAKKKQLEALSRRDTVMLIVLGSAYPKAQAESSATTIARDFSLVIEQGYSCVAVTEFRMLDPELQRLVLQELFKQQGVDAETGIPAQKKELRDFCTAIIPLLRQTSPEVAEELIGVMEKQDPLQSVWGSLDRLQGTMTQFRQTMQEMLGSVDLRVLSKRIADFAKDWQVPDLPEQFSHLCQLFEDSNISLGSVDKAFREGSISIEDFSEIINTLTVTLDNAVQDLLGQMELATETSVKAAGDSPVAAIQEFRRSILFGQDIVNKKVADTLVGVYQRSEGKTLIKLDPEAYGVVNDSLQRLKDNGEAVVLLPMMFCERQPGELSSADDLQFLQGSYELSNDQTRSNFSIAIRYLYEQVLQKDRKQRAENREQLLKDLREVEKFMEELKEKIKTFYKRLTDVQQKNKLEKIYTAVSMYTQAIAALKTEQTGTKLFAQKSLFTVAWFEDALNTERWKKTVQVLMDTVAA